MQESFIQDKTFEKTDTILKAEYENCIFLNCNFSESDLSEYKFIECDFKQCNLSLSNLNKTAFRNVKFIDCKMLGLRFDICNEFGLSFSFDRCQLNHSSFYQTKIKKTFFKNSQIQDVDFVETNLTHAIFDNCDLASSIFESTTLEKADFRTSFNYSIDPENNKIRHAKFSLNGVSGLLHKYDIEIEL